MNRQEHMQEAQDLLKRADEESTDGGNDRIAAEFMWGAFAHCLITVAQNNGLPHDSHGTFRIIAQHMDAAQGSNDSVQPRDYIATFITETCQPKNCELTDGIPGKVRRNSSGPCKLAPEYNLPMENRQQCRSKADAAEWTPSACRPTTGNLAKGKRTE